ncbi:hypothetical protein [Agromyces aureus]|uniref:Uncharacterized protein n=1 Tax=Agromyces aureus TaxID=453304 RepID=A0A191WF44_9MICO|nr:hypothetical protein [Agromyces aureus]ANJ26799.1 hypothetical protein ATC03_08805 [Agromyces aureus]
MGANDAREQLEVGQRLIAELEAENARLRAELADWLREAQARSIQRDNLARLHEVATERNAELATERDEFRRLFAECHPVHLKGVQEAARLAAVVEHAKEIVGDPAPEYMPGSEYARRVFALRPLLAAAGTDAALTAWHAKQHEGETIALEGDFITVTVDKCTCCGADQYGHSAHEPHCGTEPLQNVADAVREVRAKALEEAADGLAADPAAKSWELWDSDRREYCTPIDWLRVRATATREGRS